MNKVYNTFLIWLFHQRKKQTPVGDLARDAFQDHEWDGTMQGLKSRIEVQHVQLAGGCLPAFDSYDQALKLYRAQRKKY